MALKVKYDLIGFREGLRRNYPNLRALELIDSGCVLYCPLRRAEAGITPDLSGKGNNGKVIGPVLTKIGEKYYVKWRGKLIEIGESAVSFDGVDDYVDCGNKPEFDLKGKATLETWVNFATAPNNSPILAKDEGGGSKNKWVWYYASNRIVFHRNDTSGAGQDANDSIWSPTLNKWYHLIVVKDGVNYTFYRDGVQTATDSITLDTPTINHALDIGWSEGSFYLKGLIDEVRIYNRALSAEEIRYLYNRKQPIAHWKFDEGAGATAYDSSINGNTGTFGAGAAAPTWTEGKIGRALSFDGTNDYVNVGAVQDFRNKDFTISFWVYSNGYTSQGSMFNCLLANGDASESGTMSTFSFCTTSINDLYFGVSEEWAVYPSSILGRWVHAVGVQNVVNNNVKIYINGVLQATTPTTRELESTSSIYIGRDSGAGRFFNGFIDDVRIYNYARTASEILADYNAGMSTYFK